MNKMTRGFVVALFTLALGAPVMAQQASEDARKKAEAQRKAEEEGRQNLNKQAAEQAEAVARASQKVAEEAAAKARADEQRRQAEAQRTIPLDIEIVVSRYQGDKKVSSLPYTLVVNAVRKITANQEPMTRLRMGGKIPVPMVATPVDADGKPVGAVFAGGPVQYQDIGTRIDCGARTLDDGRFEVYITVDDTAIAPAAQSSGATAGGPPAIRTFQATNTLTMRDGQTRQFTAAADRVTGEIVRIDVTVRVSK